MTSVYHGDGFTVQSAGMNCLLYKEGSRSALIHGEVLVIDEKEPKTGIALYPGTIRWESETRKIDEEEMHRILSGVVEALSSWGVYHEVP